MLGNVAYPLGCCMDAARRDGDMSWEHINKLWHETFATDARYKVWFIASSGDTYMMRVGWQKILIQFRFGVTYSREYTDSNIYEQKPCFECCEVCNGYVTYRPRYQYDVLI